MNRPKKKKRRTQRKPIRLPFIFLCSVGILAFGTLSVLNGIPHVIDMVYGDWWAALFMCLPLAAWGLVVEGLYERASDRTRLYWDIFIRINAFYGGGAYVLGIAFDAYGLFPDLEFEWGFLTITGQICLEVALIHVFWQWVKKLREARSRPEKDPHYEKKKQAFQEISTELEQRVKNSSEQKAEYQLLLLRHERHLKLAPLLNVDRDLKDAEELLTSATASLNLDRFNAWKETSLKAREETNRVFKETQDALAMKQAEKDLLIFKNERDGIRKRSHGLRDAEEALALKAIEERAEANFLNYKKHHADDFAEALCNHHQNK